MAQRTGVYIFRPTLLPLLFAAGFAASVLIALTLLIIFKRLDLQGWLWSGLFGLGAIATLVWVYRAPKPSIHIDAQRGVVELREGAKVDERPLRSFKRLRIDKREERVTRHGKGIKSSSFTTIYTLYLDQLLLRQGPRTLLHQARELAGVLSLPLLNQCGTSPVQEDGSATYLNRLRKRTHNAPASWLGLERHCIRSLSGTDLAPAANPPDWREDACPSLTFDQTRVCFTIPAEGRHGLFAFLSIVSAFLGFGSLSVGFSSQLWSTSNILLGVQGLVLTLLALMCTRQWMLLGYAPRRFILSATTLSIYAEYGPFKRERRFAIDQLLDLFSEHDTQANLGRSDTGYSVYVDTGKRHPIARHLESKQAEELVAALQWALCELGKEQVSSA